MSLSLDVANASDLILFIYFFLSYPHYKISSDLCLGFASFRELNVVEIDPKLDQIQRVSRSRSNCISSRYLDLGQHTKLIPIWI